MATSIKGSDLLKVCDFPAISSKATSFTLLSCQTTTLLYLSFAIKSTALTPNALAISLSLCVGWAPLWTWPSTVTRVSASVSLYISSPRYAPIPPSLTSPSTNLTVAFFPSSFFTASATTIRAWFLPLLLMLSIWFAIPYIE